MNANDAALTAAITGYMQNRAILCERMTMLDRYRKFDGFLPAMATLAAEVARIDAAVALLLGGTAPNLTSKTT